MIMAGGTTAPVYIAQRAIIIRQSHLGKVEHRPQRLDGAASQQSLNLVTQLIHIISAT
jgi:hypothetical protein